MTDDDPLDGADIGETVTVEHTEEVWIDRFEDPNARGADRFRDSRITNVELVEDEYGDPSVAVTVESDVTKRLPRRWDAAREPRTASERRQARRKRWVSRGITATVTAVTIGLGVLVTNQVARRFNDQLVLAGEPATMPTGWELLPGVLAVVAFAALIVFGIKHLPGGQYGGAR